MMTPDQLDALSDNEIGTIASGGMGPKLRNEFYASFRDALRRLRNVEPSAIDQFRRSVALSEQGGPGSSPDMRSG